MNLSAPQRKITALARQPRRRWGGCLLRAFALLALLVSGTTLILQVYGNDVVPPVVDSVRNVIGAEAMAEIEAQYYGFIEALHQWQRDRGWLPAARAPWAVPSPMAQSAPVQTPEARLLGSPVPSSGATPIRPGGISTPVTPPIRSGIAPRPLAPAPPARTSPPAPKRAAPLQPSGAPPALVPIVPDGTLANEGLWTAADLALPPDGSPPVLWKTYLRPNAARYDALVYLVRFDPHRITLHMVAGTQEPGGADGGYGSGQVAAADLPRLVAAFNGGWKAINGDYGMMVDGLQIAPPLARGDTATVAVHADGRVEIGPWHTVSQAPDLVSYRQNCPLLIDNSTITVQDHVTSTWGVSPLNRMYVWRSGLGLTAEGDLIYAAGTPISANELAAALQRAGAVYAMQLDINSAWVHWLNYTRPPTGHLRPEPLVPGMAFHPNQYLVPGARDFFYLTWPDPRSARPAQPSPTPPVP